MDLLIYPPAPPRVLRAPAADQARQAQLGLVDPAPLPAIENLRAPSAMTAAAVGDAALADNVATHEPEDIGAAVRDAKWPRVYVSVRLG